VVAANFSGEDVALTVPEVGRTSLLSTNYASPGEPALLRPWEARIHRT